MSSYQEFQPVGRCGDIRMDCVIRPASSSDAEGISRIIIAALRDTNAKDYSEAVIARVEQSFSPAAVSELMTRRLVFVALAGPATSKPATD